MSTKKIVVFETKLTQEETLGIINTLMCFYDNLETIQDYF